MSQHMIEVLEGVREKVKQGWTQGAMARLENGEPTYSCDPDATSWCLRGACYSAAFEVAGNFDSLEELTDIIRTYLIQNTDSDNGFLMNYNDDVARTDQQEIVNLITGVIEEYKDN